jgi:hypothetical protein
MEPIDYGPSEFGLPEDTSEIPWGFEVEPDYRGKTCPPVGQPIIGI